MDKFVIQGGIPLVGEIPVSGAKNAALPALAASLLTTERVILHRIPQVRDVRTMIDLIRHTGAKVEVNGDTVSICADQLDKPEAPYEIVKTMRASSLVLGPLVARCGRARVSLPGGCAIGARPINLHVAALERLGAAVTQEHGYIEAVAEGKDADAPNSLHGARVSFGRISVTGTEDLLMAAVLAKGETVIENAAREPEVADLADLLIKMGAQIEGAGTATIRVQGVERLHGAEHSIIPDRIEAGTFLLAGALTRGNLTVTECEPEHLGALISRMCEAGAEISESRPGALTVKVPGNIKAVDISTKEHPGFATDLQAQFMAWMTQATGISFINETIFENRFMHVLELVRMGANIRVEGHQAIVAGPSPLTGAQVIASDLRASASLVIAALAARGETTIDRVYHIDRGYENIEAKLSAAGAKITRVKEK